MSAEHSLTQTSVLGALVTDATPIDSFDSLPSRRGKWEKFVSFVWDHDYYEKSDAERRLVHKLDCAMLTMLCFGYLLKMIDQTNLTYAYVSGMKEDLNIQDNQYTYMFVIYNAVYCVLQIPSNIAVLYVRPSWWLAGCEIGWAAFTFAQAGAQTYQQMYVFRFFVAFFEAPFQPVAIFLLGSWYTKNELAKRVSLWFISIPAGQAISGYMMAGIQATMHNLNGLAGWRWMYVICGCISMSDRPREVESFFILASANYLALPCGIAILFILPDFPHNTRVWFFTEEEKAMAIRRCALNGTEVATGVVSFGKLKRILTSWHFWLLCPTYIIYATGVQTYNYFPIYLKAQGYSVYLRNILPSAGFCAEIPVLLFYGYMADRMKHGRFIWTVVPLIWALIPTGILAVWPESNDLKIFAFFVGGTYLVTHIWYTWVNEICHADMHERAFIIAATNTAFFAVNSWLPAVIFLQTDGPSFRKGFPTTFACVIVAIMLLIVVFMLHQRQLREEAALFAARRDEALPSDSIEDSEKDNDTKVITRNA